MSFNRGIKRDSFGNRNFNNRGGSGGVGGSRGANMGVSGGGGGGGGMGGGMGGSMGGGGGGGGGGGMNPWEGGMMPGRGILPTPNNNLSLASPQAQLAIASNLLTNLLRSQQEVQPQVPSLLSLGNNFSGPGPNFNNQQNFQSGRFNDRPARQSMKNQRPQPYSKMGNRARDGPAGRRGPSAQQSRAPQSGNQRMNGNQIQHRNDKSSKPIPASKQNQTAKKEQQDVKTSDNEKAEAPVAKSCFDNEMEDSEKKRDAKDVKKEMEDAEALKVKDEPKDKEESADKTEKPATEEAEAAPKDAKETKETKDAKEGGVSTDKDGKMPGKKSEARHAESIYAEVPMSHMFCHVCNKHMWDGYSFENHLRGRAHKLMMQKLDESYKLKVDLMRHELRVAEEQRELSLTNSKRRGRKVSVDLSMREYCTMCDLNFYGTLSMHRKSERHQQLKTFLHPRCFPCLKEFPSRIEYDEHCLSPSHMLNAVQCEKQRKNKKKEKLAKGESEVRTAEDEEKDVGSDTKNEKEEEPGTDQEYLTDIVENIAEKKFKLPCYNYCRQNQISIGKSLVKEVTGYHCEKCRRFMLSAEDMNAHLRSIAHYRNFVQEVKALTSNTSDKEGKNAEETEDNEKDTSQNSEEYESSSKRRKVSDGDDSKQEDEMEEKEDNEDSSAASQKKTDGDEKYDPLEADAESEEEENQETETGQQNEQATKNTQDKKASVDKIWTDADNENDIGNLIDDGEEKEKEEKEEKEDKESEKSLPANTEREESSSLNDSSVVKSSPGRGRGGFIRGRGGPRARRSRR